jgi:hypothetical protein
MFTKTAIALAIVVGTASGALAGIKQNSSDPNRSAYDCPDAHVGSNPGILINRPQNGLCDAPE